MYLKSLELHGFKSFPEKTTLKFNKGTTVIVGPNGSGKSNITDAMRWVLGELSSKNIRGSKMEDVIFAGAAEQKPMSFAEVSVTFDDSTEPKTLRSEYDEVTVTRRYYRSGDSEYYINKKKCRLKDIYQLFMNTGIGREGYSIIGQGRIAEIISKKSEERRGVFEESAGIAKYRFKKNESEKKLAETEANMERIGDIEHELASRVGPLEKESEKARKYLELYGEKKKTDISLWIYDADKLKIAIEKTEADTKLSAHELEIAEDSINATSAQIERLYEQSHLNKEASRRNYDEAAAAQKGLSDIVSEIKVLEKEKLHSENFLENEKKLAEISCGGIESENQRVSEVEQRINAINLDYEQTNNTFGNMTEEQNKTVERVKNYTDELEKLLTEQKSAERELTDLSIRLNVLENNIREQEKRSESVDSDIKKYKSEIETLDKEAAESEKQIAVYKKTSDEADEKIKELNKKLSALREEYNSCDSETRKTQSDYDSLDSRINALSRMQEHFDGYNVSIKHVMGEAKAGRLCGIRGPVSYLIKVEKEYVVAIETSLGAALQNIVTDDENAAKASIESLKRNNAGRATFYPLTTIRAQERSRDYVGLENSRGFVGWADELVSCDDEYRAVVKSLLARVVVYDNIDNATEAARSKGWKIRAVTLDGQQINAGGSFTGGQTKRDSGMLSRSSAIESLHTEQGEIAKHLNELKAKLREIREQGALISADIKSEEDRRGLIGALISAESRNFSDADGKRKALINLVENMESDRKNLDKTSRTNDDSLKTINEMIEVKKANAADISEKRDEIASLRGEAELEADEREDKINEIKIHLAELSKDKEAAENLLSEAKERLRSHRIEYEAHNEAVAEHEGKIKTIDDTISDKNAAEEQLRVQIDELRKKQKSLEESGDKIDTQLTSLRQTEKEQNAKKELVFIAHSKNETKLSSLQENAQKLNAKMWEEYELTYSAAVKYSDENDCHIIEDGERAQFQNLQNEYRSKIKALGHVNVDSIEEYTDVKKRYEYIKTQLTDLRASREDLLTILGGIEDDMKRIFIEAFEKINKYFGEVFRELFGGGHAEVILTDPQNALESGIEINAAPPGKTIKNLNLLSGGEQAFIAIALLFALIKVNPSPFCIFDEIEAALDEVNVTRVGRYIKKYSDEMQIIMISHRRGTMDIADTLYGVTMQQSGISKVFTLGMGENHDNLLAEKNK